MSGSGLMDSAESKHPLRLQLIEWLLPNREDWNESCPQVMTSADPSVLAELLACLCLRDFGSDLCPAESEVKPAGGLEELYLRTAFIIPVYEAYAKSRDETKGNSNAGCCLKDVLSKVVESISRDGRQLTEAPNKVI